MINMTYSYSNISATVIKGIGASRIIITAYKGTNIYKISREFI